MMPPPPPSQKPRKRTAAWNAAGATLLGVQSHTQRKLPSGPEKHSPPLSHPSPPLQHWGSCFSLTFDALHFCYGERGSGAQGSNETNEHPPYEVWVTADDEFVLLKAQVSGYMMTQYELMSLEVHEQDD